ncbi:MAG: cobalamin-dependent protein [Candidatus Omnitrophica bacterium]|nr:cobalamin-dependent protein [Candidatus Omnitrophota bacterium]
MTRNKRKGQRPIHRILLVLPPTTCLEEGESKRTYPPLGLAYLAAALEPECEVQILDTILEGYAQHRLLEEGLFEYGLGTEDIEQRIREFQPDLVGVSCLHFVQAEQSHQVCRLVKRIDPDIVTVMGGVYPTVLTGQVLNDDTVDISVLGEGEETFLELVRALSAGKDLNTVRGIAFRDGDEQHRTASRPLMPLCAKKLPLPARHLLPIKRYSELTIRPFGYRPVLRHPFTPVVVSRGCPVGCSFCASESLWGSSYRLRDVEDVLDEMELLVSSGIREMHFFDDNLTLNKRYAAKLFDGMVERGLGLSWYAVVGLAIWTLDQALLEKMRASGCYRVGLPIEVADKSRLDSMGKPVLLGRVPALVRSVKDLGMFADGTFMLGYPGETLEDMYRTVKMALALELDSATFSIATPFPGTPLWNQCIEEGFLVKGTRLIDLRFAKGNIQTSEFGPDDLKRLRHEAWRQVQKQSSEVLVQVTQGPELF